MLIGTHQRLNAVDSFTVAADTTSLERVYSFKYLVVSMDETLSWKEQVSLLGKKISSRLAKSMCYIIKCYGSAFIWLMYCCLEELWSG